MLSNRVDQRARELEESTKAFEHRAQLTERERYLAEGSYYLRVTGESEKVAVAYRALGNYSGVDQLAKKLLLYLKSTPTQ